MSTFCQRFVLMFEWETSRDDLAAQRELAQVVLQAKPPVGEEASQRLPVAVQVAQREPQWRFPS